MTCHGQLHYRRPSLHPSIVVVNHSNHLGLSEEGAARDYVQLVVYSRDMHLTFYLL